MKYYKKSREDIRHLHLCASKPSQRGELSEIKMTYQPCPELFNCVLRRRLIVRNRFDFLYSSDEIHIDRSHRCTPVPDTRPNVKDREEDKGEVVRNKSRRRPVSAYEHIEARELKFRMNESKSEDNEERMTYETDEGTGDRAPPSRIRV